MKWNLKNFNTYAFDIATKAYFGQSDINWTQASNTEMTFEQSYYGLDVVVSRKYGFLEPYLNLGFISSTGSLASNKLSPFDSSYTSSTSAEEQISGMTYGLGLSANLSLMNFAVEVQSSYEARAAFFKASANY